MNVSTTANYKNSWAWSRLRTSWIGHGVRGSRACWREIWSWIRCQPVIQPNVGELQKSLALFEAQVSGISTTSDGESPIFLLSTGWRAGSTLLQRILITDSNLLLWGEPLGEMTIVRSIAEMLSRFISSRNLQLWKDQPDTTSGKLSISWVANLYPPGRDFRSALQCLLEQWLKAPATRMGFSRWGFKEVRLGASEAVLLHWLYPKAKFLMISRHPFDAYRSLADSGWGNVYFSYPHASVDSAASFARQWNRIAVSWSQLPAEFPAVHIKYEDLIAGSVDFRKIESWLGLDIQESIALKAPVGGTGKRARLSWYERLIIAREAAEGMRALGYPG